MVPLLVILEDVVSKKFQKRISNLNPSDHGTVFHFSTVLNAYWPKQVGGASDYVHIFILVCISHVRFNLHLQMGHNFYRMISGTGPEPIGCFHHRAMTVFNAVLL